MDKTFNSVVGEGRYTRNMRVRRIMANDHFLGKLAKKLVGAGEKAGLKKIAKENPEAAEKLKQAMTDSKVYQDGRKKVVKGATATLATAAILGAGALAAPAAGIGGGAAGVGGAAGGAAGGTGGTLAGVGAVGSGLGAISKGRDLPSSVKDIDLKKVDADLKNMSLSDGGKMIQDTAALNELAQKIKGLEKAIPDDIKNELINKIKGTGKKIGLGDVIANSRTSPELLPKTRGLKMTEDMISRESDKKLASGPELLSGNNLIILAVVLVLVVIMMFRGRAN